MAINRSGITFRGLVNYGIVRMFIGSLSCRQQVFLFHLLLHRNHLAVIYCPFHYIPGIKKKIKFRK
jgi:hypothetical protein